jgi:Ni/Co efflux regulator RcnB
MNIRRFTAVITMALSMVLAAPITHAQDRDRHDDRGGHDHFDDRDRGAARDWYKDHHDAFRHDEGRYWHRDWEPNIREGFVLTPEMRGAVRPVPRDLYGRLAPPPRGYRYVIIGDHIVLVDRGYRIHDVLHFELNF